MSYWQAGKQLDEGKYTIKKKLDIGGFAITYLAEDKNGGQCVIKTLNDIIQNSPNIDKISEDLYNEAVQAAKHINHPHIVKIIEVFTEDNLPCIVMEFIPGENLATIVENQGSLSEEKALRYIRQIGTALTQLHHGELLHRDVKPQNIIIRADKDEAVLIDFGTARKFNLNHEETHTAFYTPGYTPIEQYGSKSAQGAYTDIYALAGTLYYLLTQQVPENAISRQLHLNNKEKDPLKLPTNLNSHISTKVSEAIMEGLAFYPQDRPQTIEEFLQKFPLIIDFPPENSFFVKLKEIFKKFKGKGSFFLFLFLVFLGIIGFLNLHSIIQNPPTISPENDYSHYKNPDLCINIDYPKSWNYQATEDFRGDYITLLKVIKWLRLVTPLI